ncbi:MAG: hypothetical protein H6633_02150 [Anaerolineales bacterium]|nr:hypothetical protein [Anaerolineales bacterium]
MKDAQPNSSQPFTINFSGNFAGSGRNEDYILVDDGSDTTNSVTITGLASDTTYSVVEAVTSGWSLTNITCDAPAAIIFVQLRRVDINVLDGEIATCTFTNTQNATATPTNTPVPPTATPTATTNTPVPPTATPTDTPTNRSRPRPRRPTHRPTPPIPPTATPTDTPTATATNTATATPTDTPTNTPTNTPVPPTATPTNTATNTPIPPTATPTNTPAPGTIEIEKSSFGGTGTFNFTSPQLGDFSITTLTPIDGYGKIFDNLAPGTYSVTEVPDPDWTLGEVRCHDKDDTSITYTNDNLTLSPGQTINVYSSTNTRRRPARSSSSRMPSPKALPSSCSSATFLGSVASPWWMTAAASTTPKPSPTSVRAIIL